MPSNVIRPLVVSKANSIADVSFGMVAVCTSAVPVETRRWWLVARWVLGRKDASYQVVTRTGVMSSTPVTTGGGGGTNGVTTAGAWSLYCCLDSTLASSAA